jgi:hypothetical protein
MPSLNRIESTKDLKRVEEKKDYNLVVIESVNEVSMNTNEDALSPTK